MGQAVIQQVFSKIAESARELRMPLDSSEIQEAREIAIMAVNDGYGVEDAFRFARNALVPGAGKIDIDPVSPERLSA